VIFFIDASSLVKRYIEEVGSDTVREILRRPDHGGAFYVSDHVLLEVLVRLAKHLRTSGRSRRREYAKALRQFDRDREIFNVVPAGTRVVARAEQFAVEFARSGAGTLDLLHASSAELVQHTISDEVLVFVVSDRKLRHLVRLMGFQVFDPQRDRLEDLPPSLPI
jgi:predicted nucleic acid-binding protein